MNREHLLAAVRATLKHSDATAFARIFDQVQCADLAEALSDLEPEQLALLLCWLAPARRARLFEHLPEFQQDLLLPVLHHPAIADLFKALPSDEQADLYNRLDTETQSRLLPALAQDDRDGLLKLAAYPEGSAGSLTASDYAAVNADMTATEALAALRSSAPDKETIYVIYVLDPEGHLQGTLSLRELVLAAPQARIADLMRPHPVFVRAEWPALQAAELIRRHSLLALPVINGGERMIGIVTVDDAMTLEKEEDATQLTRFGGVAAMQGDDLDLRTSPFRQLFQVRAFWLVILTCFGILTSTYIAAQTEMLEQIIILAAFIAPIIDTGGNTGSQAATLVIRSMALGDFRLRGRDMWFVIRRELPVALALGLAIAVLESILAYFSKGVQGEVLLVVGLAMLLCTVLGSLIGALLPFAARKMGTDPATLSAPLITSIMDLVGVVIYFGLAYAFLGDMLAPAPLGQ
ncbi:magnesium transporter [Alcaligenaceae bacterium SJ-26]|nr:magnesium transporter [Alcaligenaceae bacterium SJ-26]